ncbi:MAG: type II secretion system F family protein, partial [Firmicutes bacterium]|nr:type II secretion system F family protein [Bacillota bacterium]MDY4107532.1 type II secretion system F family protein [Oscillospiraceae bacterium]
KIEEVKETQSWNKQIGTKKIKDKELAIICSQFAIILTSGLPIVRCVEMVAAQARTKELQKMLKKVAEDISGGYSLAQSFENNATGFPTTFIETVRAGERSGNMEETLTVISDYFDNEVSVFTQRLLSMLEPAITIVLAVVTVILLLAVYLPMFTMYGSIV